ncbi:MAG: dockerin type I domain-containing protein [Pirellulales bacterium]
MQIVRKEKPGRKQTRKRMPRPFGFQPLERRALLAADLGAADLGAEWEAFVELEKVDESSDMQVWTDEKVADDDISIRIRSFGGDEGDVPTLEEGQVETFEYFDLAAASAPTDVEIRTFGDLGEDEIHFEATDIAAMSGEVFGGGGWHNFDAPHDVNADGFVSPIDALLLVTYLNDHGVGEFGEGEGPSIYPDIDGDGQLAPLDALLLFNYLNDNLPSLDGFQFAADEAQPENEAAGLVASRMAWDADEVDEALGRYAIWADDASPAEFAEELSEEKRDDGSLAASDLGDSASDEWVDELVAK